MGVAVTSGILATLKDLQNDKASSSTELPSRLPSRVIATVRSEGSQKKVQAAFSAYESAAAIDVFRGNNVEAVKASDLVLLACKPYMVKDILAESGLVDALKGKILVSICAGWTEEKLAEITGPETTVVRAMPNTASLIREGMTVIGTSTPPLPQETTTLLTWMFKCIGDVVYLPPHLMDVSTALCGSAPAFFSLMLDGAIDGAVAMGVPRADATRMAAQVMRGAAGLVQSGEHPAILREKVSTPGGCTIGGLLVLEDAAVRGTVARSIREATVVASQLGKGVQGVNGTRHPPLQ